MRQGKTFRCSPDDRFAASRKLPKMDSLSYSVEAITSQTKSNALIEC